MLVWAIAKMEAAESAAPLFASIERQATQERGGLGRYDPQSLVRRHPSSRGCSHLRMMVMLLLLLLVCVHV